jgi:transcriptional regulator with XRE-family HTH domain
VNTVERLLEARRLSIEELAALSNLSADRVAAIADGRWTPSPEERQALASALGVSVEEISWGHSMNPRNIRYRRFGLRENF